MPTVRVSDHDFESVVLGSKLPVLVDFWAAWCGPCKLVAPILEEVSEEHAGALVVAKVDVDHARRVAATYRIRSIPTLMLFENGQPVQSIEGALPKQRLADLLRKWLPGLGGGKPSTRISVAELAQRMSDSKPTMILDVRRELDFRRSHLRGAINASPEALEGLLGALGPGELAVLVCRTGEESEALAKQHAEKGRFVAALEKGLLEWEGSGKPTYSNEEEAELLGAQARE
ncbi:MAG: thioredoxin [Deltaproteobacteria bacterium]|nr:thioredoxin [Deltaproteobacteria bacterium]